MKNTNRIFTLSVIFGAISLTAITTLKAAESIFQDGLVLGGTALTPGLLLEVEGKIGAQELCNESGAECTDVSAIYSTVIAGAGGITGSGTSGFLPKFTAAQVVGNSLIQDNGTNVGIGSASLGGHKLHVNGNLRIESRNLYFGSTKRLYGDSTHGLHYRSNSSTNTSLIMRDAENKHYGQIYGSGDGAYFGLLDGDGHWLLQHQKDVQTHWKINNVEYMRLTSTGLDIQGSVSVDDDTRTCNSSAEGAMRYKSNQIEFCDGANWDTPGFSGLKKCDTLGGEVKDGSCQFSYESTGTFTLVKA